MTAKSDGFLRGQLATARRDRDDLKQALKDMLNKHPVYRGKPMGAPGSEVRMIQDDAIAAEDAAKVIIAKVEERAS